MSKTDSKTWTILELINETTAYFKKYNIENPRLNIERILEDVLKLKRMDLYLNFDRPIQNSEIVIIREMVKKRACHIPLYYILGHAPFLNWNFKVNPSVLIPRPETELLVEKTMLLVNNMEFSHFHILDIGTGSGCIAISLAKSISNVTVTACDNSMHALNIAKENAQNLGVLEKINFVFMDILQTDISFPDIPFQIIVSNPPYIKHNEFYSLQEEVKQEPVSALSGGKDGLDFYNKITDKISDLIIHGGYVLMEIGSDMGKEVKAIFKKNTSCTSVEIFKDYQSLDRIVVAKF
ncbi:MAG: peptide chain release factor N(5)-glutamine methyltransferase [Candidatus Firestonebacteria bacterium]|nr:peptide chain release factor N(5)-glutamine methyltransferase [Candidatus Firestonebacteria bacterium]